MRLLRHLQHWLTGTGRPLRVADFGPETHSVQQWADPCPWAALVAAVERTFAQRFPTLTARGRAPAATHGLLTLALLKHERHCSDMY
jgi:hypothetical protein